MTDEPTLAATEAPAHTGPPSAFARNATIGVLVAMVVANYVGGALFPSLVVKHPLTLISLNASNRHLALASGALSAPAFYIAGTIGRLVLIRTFSSVFEGPLGDLRHFIGDYRVPLTILSIVLVVVAIVADVRGGRDSVGDLVNLEEGIAEAEAELEAEATIDAEGASEAE